MGQAADSSGGLTLRFPCLAAHGSCSEEERAAAASVLAAISRAQRAAEEAASATGEGAGGLRRRSTSLPLFPHEAACWRGAGEGVQARRAAVRVCKHPQPAQLGLRGLFAPAPAAPGALEAAIGRAEEKGALWGRRREDGGQR